MKKFIYISIFLIITIIISSCELQYNKKDNMPPSFTAKQQLEYLNDNLFFLDDYVKVGNSVPQIVEREDYEENKIVKKVGNQSIVRDLYTTQYYPKDNDQSLGVICFSDYTDILTGKTYVINQMATSSSMFSLFGVKVGESYKEIDKKLKERYFIAVDETAVQHNYSYGFLHINIKTISTGVIKSVSIDIIEPMDDFNTKNLFGNNYEYLTDNSLITKAIPVDVNENCLLRYSEFIYMDTDDSFIYSISYTLKETISGNIFILPDDPDIIYRMQSHLKIYYYNTDYNIRNSVQDNKITGKDTKEFIKNTDYNSINSLICQTYKVTDDIKNSFFDFSDALEKYNYIKEAVESEPGYDEYRQKHTVIILG